MCFSKNNVVMLLEKYKIYVGEIQGLCWRNASFMLEKYKDYVGEIQGLCWRNTRVMLEKYEMVRGSTGNFESQCLCSLKRIFHP